MKIAGYDLGNELREVETRRASRWSYSSCFDSDVGTFILYEHTRELFIRISDTLLVDHLREGTFRDTLIYIIDSYRPHDYVNIDELTHQQPIMNNNDDNELEEFFNSIKVV